jgi:hypothetical protein
MISRRFSASSTDAEWNEFAAMARALLDAQTAYCVHCASEYPRYLNACPDCGWPTCLIPVPTSFLSAALHDGGRGVVVAFRAGVVQIAHAWGQRKRLQTAAHPETCHCTNGGIKAPLINCPHCRGEGTVRK